MGPVRRTRRLRSSARVIVRNGGLVLIYTARLLLRRWPWALLSVVLAVATSVAAVVVTPPTYESRAQVLFLPPITQPGVDGKVNPFLALGAALGVTADIVRLQVGDDSTREELVAQGAVEDYEVTTYLAENGGPILNISVDDTDAQATARTVTLLVDRITNDLEQIQNAADAPDGTYIRATLLTSTPSPEPLLKSRLRAAAVGFAGALFLLLALVVVGDRLAARRRPRSDETRDGLDEPVFTEDVARRDDLDDVPERDRTRTTAGSGGRR